MSGAATNPGLEAAYDRLRAEGRPQWIESTRRYQRSLAEVSAAKPRKVHEFYYYGLGGDIVEAIRARPNDPALCWPIIRGLATFLRLSDAWLRELGLSPRYPTLTMGHGFPARNARILILAELYRMKAVKDARRFPQAAE